MTGLHLHMQHLKSPMLADKTFFFRGINTRGWIYDLPYMKRLNQGPGSLLGQLYMETRTKCEMANMQSHLRCGLIFIDIRE